MAAARQSLERLDALRRVSASRGCAVELALDRLVVARADLGHGSFCRGQSLAFSAATLDQKLGLHGGSRRAGLACRAPDVAAATVSPRLLCDLALSSANALALVWGIYSAEMVLTIVSTINVLVAKSWSNDRMVWLFSERCRTNPEYASWLR
jgi:hypothetical protein